MFPPLRIFGFKQAVGSGFAVSFPVDISLSGL